MSARATRRCARAALRGRGVGGRGIVGGFEEELALACIVPKILPELRMNTQALPPPSWLIHQTALASWIPEA